jgi:proline dehydrogenase
MAHTHAQRCRHSRPLQAYKYVPFGGVEQVIPYLLRRAQENSDVLGGVQKELIMMKAEVRRRLLGR